MAYTEKTKAAATAAAKEEAAATLAADQAAATGDPKPDAIEGPAKIVPASKLDPEVAEHVGDLKLPESVFIETLPGETQEEAAIRRNRDHEIATRKILREGKT